MSVAQDTSVEANKELARRFFTEIWSKGDLNTLYEILADDFMLHYSVPPYDVNREQMKETMIEDREVFEDLTYDILDTTGGEDKVAILWRMRSKHIGEWQGIKATNKDVSLKGMTLFTMKDGKIVDAAAISDALSLLTQLGAIKHVTN